MTTVTLYRTWDSRDPARTDRFHGSRIAALQWINREYRVPLAAWQDVDAVTIDGRQLGGEGRPEPMAGPVTIRIEAVEVEPTRAGIAAALNELPVRERP